MASRTKWLFAALTALVAVLTAATFAQAVDQTPKNGCTSPESYSGSITTPAFQADTGAEVQFDGWFEVESVNTSFVDSATVEYTTPANPSPTPIAIPPDDSLQSQSTAPTSGGPDQPYSNMGTNVSPAFQSYIFPLPPEAIGVPGVQVRITFNTSDNLYQGFRGVGIDNLTITQSTPAISSGGFENGFPANWAHDPASGPGAPFWQVLQNPQNVSVKSPEINPTLVTLPDAGALPPPLAASGGSRYAWFGNVASGTFCGPDFASVDVAPDTTITNGPPASTASKDATFSFAASEPALLFQCQLDGGPPTPCASPQSYSALANGSHTFSVQATDQTGNTDPTPATYAWTIREATLADLPNPQVGVSANVEPVSGTVTVGIPAAAAAGSRGSARASQKGVTFVPLSEARQIPVGSFINTTKGTVRLQSAVNSTGKRQTGTFLQALFQLRQSKKRSARGLTDLILKGSSFRRCRTGSGKGASAAALSRRRIRRLRARARGRFRTSGRNSSATVRGTVWDTTDRCDGTLTKVRRGRVVVRDFRRKKNIVVTTGKSYLARAKG